MVGSYPSRGIPHGARPVRRLAQASSTDMEKEKIRMIDIERLIDALCALFELRSYRIIVGQQQKGWTPRRLLAPDALLPVIIRLAEDQWTPTHGQASFGLGIDHNESALCGHVLNAVHYAPISVIVLCVDHMLQQLVDSKGQITIEAMEEYAQELCSNAHSQPVHAE